MYITDIASWCNIHFNNRTAIPLYYAHNLYFNGEFVTELIIPHGVTSIGAYTFSNCSGLNSVTIPDSVTSINSEAFLGCDNLIQIENGVRYIDKWVVIVIPLQLK